MTESRVPTQSLDDTLRAWGLDPADFIESLTGWGYEIRRSAQPAPAPDVERIVVEVIHRWKHPSFAIDDYRCRCRMDARNAIDLLVSDD